ncbi:MAG: phosphomannomutase/phosphoglucomutase, partial [Clostridia bacterium]|nr:phosphomannomutase/phosphoglucomutase [Clostridia bacterium]
LISLAQLAKQGKDLTSLISSLKKPAEEAEIRIGFGAASKDFKAEGAKVIEELKHTAEQTAGLKVEKVNYEGVRIYFDGGLMLVRMSVHDPVMPINIESGEKGGEKGGVKRAAQTLLSLLERYEFLNTENLQKFIKSF